MNPRELEKEYPWLDRYHCRRCQYGEARHKETAAWLYHKGALVGQVIRRSCPASRCEVTVYFQIWQDKDHQAKGEALLRRRLENGNHDQVQELTKYEYLLLDFDSTPDEAVAHLIDEKPRNP